MSLWPKSIPFVSSNIKLSQMPSLQSFCPRPLYLFVFFPRNYCFSCSSIATLLSEFLGVMMIILLISIVLVETADSFSSRSARHPLVGLIQIPQPIIRVEYFHLKVERKADKTRVKLCVGMQPALVFIYSLFCIVTHIWFCAALMGMFQFLLTLLQSADLYRVISVVIGTFSNCNNLSFSHLQAAQTPDSQ